MILNESLKVELISAIRAATEAQTAFPLKVESRSGKFTHIVSVDRQSTGLLISVLEVDGTSYRIYMI